MKYPTDIRAKFNWDIYQPLLGWPRFRKETSQEVLKTVKIEDLTGKKMKQKEQKRLYKGNLGTLPKKS